MAGRGRHRGRAMEGSMARRLRRLLPVLVTASLLVATILVTAAPVAAANKPGNSPNAKLCYKGGWATLYQSDGSTFASETACVSYAAKGGTLLTSPPNSWQQFCLSIPGVNETPLSGGSTTVYQCSGVSNAEFASIGGIGRTLTECTLIGGSSTIYFINLDLLEFRVYVP